MAIEAVTIVGIVCITAYSYILAGGYSVDGGWTTSDEPHHGTIVRLVQASPPADDSSSGAKSGDGGLGEYVPFSSIGIKVMQPDGFVVSEAFAGFAQAESQSSVLLLKMPAPYEKMLDGLSPEQMKKRGFIDRGRQVNEVGGTPGMLLHFDQLGPNGQLFTKWTLIFGDDAKTIIVTAAFPKEMEEQLSAQLKAAVQSTRLDDSTPPEAGSDLPFTLQGSAKLKAMAGTSGALVFLRDGAVPGKSPKDPLFIAAPVVREIAPENRRVHAERRLHLTAQIQDLAIKSTDPITVDGLEGYETIAEAKDKQSGTPLAVYQVILFVDDAYILMQGMVGIDLSEEYSPEFKAVARSLKLKPPSSKQ
jgi:hypothetical protein